MRSAGSGRAAYGPSASTQLSVGRLRDGHPGVPVPHFAGCGCTGGLVEEEPWVRAVAELTACAAAQRGAGPTEAGDVFVMFF